MESIPEYVFDVLFKKYLHIYRPICILAILYTKHSDFGKMSRGIILYLVCHFRSTLEEGENYLIPSSMFVRLCILCNQQSY